MNKADKLYIVIPCYNEEEVLEETRHQLEHKLKEMISSGLISHTSRIVFVDDGSFDGTWNIIKKMHQEDQMVLGIKSSRNRGHQNALLEGLMTVKNECDAVVSMDADLQDDIEVLDQFMHQYYEGCDIVYGVRNARETDSLFKKFTAEGFYTIMSKFGVEMIYNHADYRLMSKRALECLGDFKEVNLFLRGMVPMIGFKTGIVTYERFQRFAGKSKYPLKKMLAFAVDGITSFTIKPIRFISSLGVLLFLISMILLLHYLIGYFMGNTVEGWATLVVSIWGIGGLQLLAIGIIGEYIGKIYLEAKGRPRFIVEEFLGDEVT
ncbi:MAG: glycosyltransferase family 2 protein [Eubacterium sp.]|nr:glycosyltransferase family 2 protein [Eubacterium sp.]